MKIGSLKEIKHYPDKFWHSMQFYPFKWSQYEISYTIYYNNKEKEPVNIKYIAMWYGNMFGHIKEYDMNTGHLEIRRYKKISKEVKTMEISIEVD